jgi:hypothetical protein
MLKVCTRLPGAGRMGTLISLHSSVFPWAFPPPCLCTDDRPHDVWDKWIELHGRSLDAFFPVVDTDIGKIGLCLANEGSYPALSRGLTITGRR